MRDTEATDDSLLYILETHDSSSWRLNLSQILAGCQEMQDYLKMSEQYKVFGINVSFDYNRNPTGGDIFPKMLMYYETEKITVRYPKTASNVMSWSMVNPGTKNYNVHLNNRTIPKEYIGWLNTSTAYNTRIYLTIGQQEKVFITGNPEYMRLGTIKITFNVKFRLRDQSVNINKGEGMTIQQERFMKQSSNSSISFESLTDETNKSLIPKQASPDRSNKTLKSFLHLSSGSSCKTMVQVDKTVKCTKIEKFKQEMEDQAAYANLVFDCFSKMNIKYRKGKDIGFVSTEQALYMNNYIIKQNPAKFNVEQLKALRLLIETLPRLSNYKTCPRMKFIKNNLMNYYEFAKSPQLEKEKILVFNPTQMDNNHNKAYYDAKYNEEQRKKKEQELRDYRNRMEKRAEDRDRKTDANRNLNAHLALDRMNEGRQQHKERMRQCKKFHEENQQRNQQRSYTQNEQDSSYKTITKHSVYQNDYYQKEDEYDKACDLLNPFNRD